MKIVLFLAIFLLCHSSFVFGQTKTLTGKIVDKEFNPIGAVMIESSDTILLTTTDFQTGEFKIHVTDSMKSLLIRCVGYEWKPIILDITCKQLDVILERNTFYDFITMEETDRLRLKQFKKLPKLHREAYNRGVFKTEQPCYKQRFMAATKWKRFQKII